jgi:hypothetical protein
MDYLESAVVPLLTLFKGMTLMTGQQPIMTDDEDGVVIQFRPRAPAKPPAPLSFAANNDRALRGSSVDDYGPQGPADADDYRRRMWMNLAAMVFTLMLTAVAVWLATTISDLRQAQDCLMVGRRDCSRLPLSRPPLPRPGESI